MGSPWALPCRLLWAPWALVVPPWALVGPPWALCGPPSRTCGPPGSLWATLSLSGPGPCGPPGPLWNGPLWAGPCGPPWAIMGPNCPSKASPRRGTFQRLPFTYYIHIYISMYIYTYTRIKCALRARRGLQDYIMGLCYRTILRNHITG